MVLVLNLLVWFSACVVVALVFGRWFYNLPAQDEIGKRRIRIAVVGECFARYVLLDQGDNERRGWMADGV